MLREILGPQTKYEAAGETLIVGSSMMCVHFTKYYSDHIIKQDEIGKGIYTRVLMGNVNGQDHSGD